MKVGDRVVGPLGEGTVVNVCSTTGTPSVRYDSYNYDKDYEPGNGACHTFAGRVSPVTHIADIDEADYCVIAAEIAELVKEKQVAYGDSFGKSGAVLALLYPNGIQPSQYTDVLTIARVVDKLFRVATAKDAFGEDPWRDVMGYALLSCSRHVRQR